MRALAGGHPSAKNDLLSLEYPVSLSLPPSSDRVSCLRVVVAILSTLTSLEPLDVGMKVLIVFFLFSMDALIGIRFSSRRSRAKRYLSEVSVCRRLSSDYFLLFLDNTTRLLSIDTNTHTHIHLYHTQLDLCVQKKIIWVSLSSNALIFIEHR